GLRGLRERNGLRDEVFRRAWLRVIVWPSVYRRNLSRPVSMTWMNWRSPLQGVGSPWVLGSLSSSVHAVEEVEQEDELRSEGDDRGSRYKHVQVSIMLSEGEVGPGIVSSREARNTDVVHWEKHQIHTCEGQPEVDISQLRIHHSAKQFWEPVIDTGDHSEERGRTHYQVEVSYYEISVVQLDIDRRVS